MGGVAMDRSCRVTDSSGQSIPGLYAVGELKGLRESTARRRWKALRPGKRNLLARTKGAKRAAADRKPRAFGRN